jgi:hypothetical protein
VPWCDACDRFLSPSTVRHDGTCPSCGRPVDPGWARPATASTAGAAAPARPEGAGEPEEELGPVPWHFKALAGALAVYLGYRAWQGIEWVIGRF